MNINEPNVADLLATKRWVYNCDETEPHPTDRTRFQVSVVIEGISGHYPTGTDRQKPWFWTKDVCKARNAERGFSEPQALKIVLSSMFPRR
jgi:hypothetical protein